MSLAIRVMPMPGKARRSFLTLCAHVDEGCRAFCVCHVFLKRKADEKLGRLHPLRAYDRPIVQCFRMGLSQDYRYQTEAPPTYALMCRRQMHRLVPAASEGPTFSGMEVEIDMTGKMAAIVAAVVLIASAGVASAQPKRHVPRTDQWQAPYAQTQVPYADTYYNRDYWAGVYPAGRSEPRDPLAGTVFEGVAPY